MPWVERASYLERLRSVEGTGDIKVITGVRRSGKSELMKAFSAELKKRDPLSNSLYIDLLDLDNEELLEYHALHDRIAKPTRMVVETVYSLMRCNGARASRGRSTVSMPGEGGTSTSPGRMRSF